MADYDVNEAFRSIENELLDSMIRNLSHHRAEETKEGINWTSWQAEQLNALNDYKKRNKKTFNKRFTEINSKIEESIRAHSLLGEIDQEKEILEAIKKGAKLKRNSSNTMEGSFFRINDRKLEALISATHSDMTRAETAMLRMANDQYRKIIFDAQVYSNTGAGTYEQAVDMATKDFLSRGINCVQYKNGARVNIASYAAMALRTANTRAYLQGEGNKRQEWGITTVIVNRRGNPCLLCAKWAGKVLIDDVWSGGKASDGPYPLMSQAMAGGLYHPNCKDIHTTYFPGITEVPKPVTKNEMEKSVEEYKNTQRENKIQSNIDKFERLANGSLDESNKDQNIRKFKQWKNVANSENSNIIKNITVDDFELMTSDKGIDNKALDIIYDTIHEYEKKGELYISDVFAGSLKKTDAGIPLLQIEPMSNGLNKLNINTDIFSNYSLAEINERIKTTKSIVSEDLKDAVVHECGHSKLIRGKSLDDIEKLYDEIKDSGVNGISTIALKDGVECIAETEVMIHKKIKIPEDAVILYEKYMGEIKW